jgi:hypothetical protein
MGTGVLLCGSRRRGGRVTPRDPGRTTIVYWDAFMGSIFTADRPAWRTACPGQVEFHPQPLWARDYGDTLWKGFGLEEPRRGQRGQDHRGRLPGRSVGHDFGGIVARGHPAIATCAWHPMRAMVTIVWHGARGKRSGREFPHGVSMGWPWTPITTRCAWASSSRALCTNIFGYGLDVNTTSLGGTTGVINCRGRQVPALNWGGAARGPSHRMVRFIHPCR